DLVAGTAYWMTDGTLGGTYLLGDLHPGNFSYTRYLGKVADRLLLTAGEFSLFSSDGTVSGTRRLLDERITRILFVNGQEGWGRLGDDELYRRDGTPEGTCLLKDLESDPWEATTCQPAYFGKAGQRILLTATTAADGKELWTTDGTEEG